MMIVKKHLLLAGLIALAGLLVDGPADAQRKPPPKPINGAENGVYLKAALPLDEPRHLCVDIPGHGGRVNVTRDMVVHSCKEGIWNLDERFVKSSIKTHDLKMPQYNLCLVAREAKAGARLGLTKCGSSKLAKWDFKEARLTLQGHPDLCLTIGPEPSALTPGGKRLPSRNKARSLAMDTCSEAALERQLWTFADPLNITKPLMPPKGM
ncbi:MAG: RICIN domain-containing protein [Rhodospirillaceae bacterium]|jgi:hypothetical protein|nr:RICIN domain-containing protein [Rhodospirillaceae bacterium]MBT4589321.1 RICIN domain-containing protein [Rhodospirillaceae bacterium]MBT7266749.1 RICIN domain-containing protein [Rhodospirillaceae bacterium]